MGKILLSTFTSARGTKIYYFFLQEGPAVNLRSWVTEIEDQFEMGSCVTNATAGKLYNIVVCHSIL